MKKRILSILLILIIIVGYTGSSYKQAQAMGFEGLIPVVGGMSLGTGIAVGLAVCGVTYASYTIYENRDELKVAGENVANAFSKFVSKTYDGAKEKVDQAKEFISSLADGAIQTGSEAWENWKEFVAGMVDGSLSLDDFDGNIYSGTLSDFPSVVKNVYFDRSGVYKVSPWDKSYVKPFAGVTSVIMGSQPVNVDDVHYLTVVFKDVAVPFVMYRSTDVHTVIGMAKSFADQKESYLYVEYNKLSHAGYNYHIGSCGLRYFSYDVNTIFPGTTDVFKIDSTWKAFTEHIQGFSKDRGMEFHSLLEGLAPRVYGIDDWGSNAWQKENISTLDEYPVEKTGLTGRTVDGVPDNVSDALSQGKAWDLAPDVYGLSGAKELPGTISIGDSIASDAFPGCTTIDEALAYARAHGIPIARVLEAVGVKVGDVANDIDYAGTIEATISAPKPDGKPTIKPFAPTAPSGSNSEYTLPGLDELFPFCVPFDVYRLISYLKAEPKAPKFKWNVPTLVKGKIKKNEFEVDFSKYDDIAKTCRTLEFIAFCLGFVLIVRKLIRG